ncbi:Protein of unknown function [Propionibacterium freudenreichii]|nr:Protein of unknown function [Propionibacterium freudenreichii]
MCSQPSSSPRRSVSEV